MQAVTAAFFQQIFWKLQKFLLFLYVFADSKRLRATLRIVCLKVKVDRTCQSACFH